MYRESFTDSCDWSIARLQSVSVFLPDRASVGPRSFGKVADGRQGSAKSSNDPIGFLNNADSKSREQN